MAIKEVTLRVLDFDDIESQSQQITINNMTMTVAELRERLGPNKHRQVRQDAVAMKYLYAAIRNREKEKAIELYTNLKAKFGEARVDECLKFHALHFAFAELVGKE